MDINNNSTSNKNGGRPVRVDWGVIVRNRVLRATQNPLYSVMREEVTRHSNSLFEHCCAGHGAPVLGMTTDARNELPFFPFNNARSSDTTVLSSEPSSQECVALIGGTGFYGKFLAEQYLNRGINVTVLARDADKARSIFLPIVDGEREAAEQRSKGMLSLIPQASRPEQLSAEHCVDDGRSAKRVLRYRYKTASTHAVAAGPDVTLEIVEGDVNAKEDLEYAMRGATLVYYLVSALPQHPTAGVRGWFSSSSWWSSDRTAAATKTSGDNEEDVAAATPASYGGFLRAFDVCRRVDAHFVALTPMWIHGSRLSPFYWHRRLTHPWGYSKAVRQEELTMLEQRGAPARRCYFGATEDADEEPRMWRYWWSILRSTKLPEDRAELHRSPVRFTLFRLSDIVYPSFNQHMAVVKNNRVNDATHMDSISSGNLDARLLAGVMSKTLALCRSVSESRIDVAGRLKGDVDMTDTAAVLDMFNTLRNE